MVFGEYAQFYDIFYRQKDYKKEVLFLESIFNRYSARPIQDILDLGCGTGNHLLPLVQRGYILTGLDGSRSMLTVAQAKLKEAKLNATLLQSRLEQFNLRHEFDAIICMFSVVDYLTRLKDLQSFFQSVHHHLSFRGVFVFDFWNASAVEKYYQPYKEKVFLFKGHTIKRRSKTTLQLKKHECVVDYTCEILLKKKRLKIFKESHRLRYFTIEEMTKLLQSYGFECLKICPFLNLNGNVRTNTWDVTIVARKMSR